MDRAIPAVSLTLLLACSPAPEPVEWVAEDAGAHRARLAAVGRHGQRLFEHTFTRPYWGEPLRVRHVRQGDAWLVRVVEYAPLGWPAFGACARLERRHGDLVATAMAEPGRDGGCPDWADPLFAD